MKRWQRLLLLLLLILVVSQVPFAYRRYQLSRLHSAIEKLNAERTTTPDGNFHEFKGVIHVHSFLGGHSNGNFDEIIAAAKSNQLDFVVMTEHTSENINTAAMTLSGAHGGVLFINGNEVAMANGDRFLLAPGLNSQEEKNQTVEDIVKSGRGKEALTFVAYPQKFHGWATDFYDGVEVYNVYTNAQDIKPAVMFFDGLWSYRSFPDLLFARFFARPTESLKKWDEAILATGRRLSAIAGNDAHANVGISLNDAAGKSLLGVRLDPFERSFRLVRVHVIIPRARSLDSEALLEALSEGHCFIGFDVFGDTSGFTFSATNGPETAIQGDEIALQGGVRLTVRLPVTGRVVLIKDGQVIQDQYEVTQREFPVTEKGVYRVEVYLPQLNKPVSDHPWIISNPIYVR